MKRLRSGILYACLVLIAMLGCRGGAEIYNVKDAPINTSTRQTPSLEQVTKAIVQGGVGLKWAMAIVEPGHIVGTFNLRSHTAVVDITYNTKTYSITYKGSTNLNYDSNTQRIHGSYRSWIQELDNNIRNRLIAIGM
jgi:hypothetical protein